MAGEVKRLGTIVAYAVDGIMARLWPLDPATRAYMPTDVLARAEERIDAWEPRMVCFLGLAEVAQARSWKWEPLPDHLDQFVSETDSADREPWTRHTDPDELWAAQQRYAVEVANEQTLDEFVVANRHTLWPTTNGPVGAAHSPAEGGAGRVTTDEVASVIAVILRGQGINSAPIYADLAARELLHHFEISRK